MSAIQRRGVLLDGIGAELVRASTGGARKTLRKWFGDLLAADAALDARVDTLEAGGAAFADVASASTVDLGAVASDKVRITGSTGPITSFGTAAAGTRKLVRLASTPTLTYNATSLILPGDANIVGQADDEFEAVSLGSGNWYVGVYQRGAYPPATNTAVMNAVTSASSLSAGQIALGVRVKLTANLACAVNYATGSDSITLAQFLAGSATATFAKAYAFLRDGVDFNGYTVTLTGTASGSVSERILLLGRCEGQKYYDQLVIDYSTIDLSGATGPMIGCFGLAAAEVRTKSILCSDSSTPAVQAYPKGADLRLKPTEFKACTKGHMQAAGGEIRLLANYTISGGAEYHALAEVMGGLVDFGSGRTVTLTGTPAFSTAFVSAGECSNIGAHGVTFSGSATGKRFNISNFGSIAENDPSDDLNATFPGDANGTILVRASTLDVLNGANKTAVTSAATGARTAALPDASGTIALTSDIAAAATSAQARDMTSTAVRLTPANLTAIGVLSGLLFGMTLSNNGSDATNDIDIAAGSCTDSTGVRLLVGSALTKQLDATWAAGNNAGGRMSAAAIANTTYHVFAIYKDSDGSVDYGFDVSATAPTMPTGYTYFRRIGSIIRAAGAILAFKQVGDNFRLVTSVLDISVSPGVNTAVTRALASVPLGIVVYPHLGVQVVSGATTNSGAYISALDETDSAASSANSQSYISAGSTNGPMGHINTVKTDTSAQIRTRTQQTDSQINIRTYGWTDLRGRVA